MSYRIFLSGGQTLKVKEILGKKGKVPTKGWLECNTKHQDILVNVDQIQMIIQYDEDEE